MCDLKCASTRPPSPKRKGGEAMFARWFGAAILVAAAILIAWIVNVVPATASTCGCDFKRGDANNDGSVNIADVVYLYAYFAGQGPRHAIKTEETSTTTAPSTSLIRCTSASTCLHQDHRHRRLSRTSGVTALSTTSSPAAHLTFLRLSVSRSIKHPLPATTSRSRSITNTRPMSTRAPQSR